MRSTTTLENVMAVVLIAGTVGAVPASLSDPGFVSGGVLSRRGDDKDGKKDDDDDDEEYRKYKNNKEYDSDDSEDDEEEYEKGGKPKPTKSSQAAYRSYKNNESKMMETPKANSPASSSLPAKETGREDYNAAAQPAPVPTTGISASNAGNANPTATVVRDTASAQSQTPTILTPQHQAAHHLALGLGIAGGIVLGIILCAAISMMYLRYKNRLPAKYDPWKLFGRRGPGGGEIPAPNGFFAPVSSRREKRTTRMYDQRLDLDEARTEMMESETTTLFAGKYSEKNTRGVTPPARAAADKRSSRGSERRQSIRFPIAGNSLPRNPSATRKRQQVSDPFSDENATKNPFEDPRGGSPEPLSIQRGNGSVRSLRTVRREPSIRIDSMKSPSPLMLTDPRVRDGRTLVVANNSQGDSLMPGQSPMPSPVASLKFPKRAAHSSSGSGAPQISRFSWTTKAETPLMDTAPRDRRSGLSSTSEQSQPQFRSINSWVAHQNKHSKKRLERDADNESDHWAKSIVDYDRKSDNSGWDTRRTMTEY